MPFQRPWEDDNFRRFFRFGLVDQSLLMMGIIAGVSFDAIIARRIGVRGYGTIVGAGVANVVADGIAGLPESLSAAAGVAAGGIIPLIPLAAVMFMRFPLNRRVGMFIGGSSATLLAGAFAHGYVYRSEIRHMREGEGDIGETVELMVEKHQNDVRLHKKQRLELQQQHRQEQLKLKLQQQQEKEDQEQRHLLQQEQEKQHTQEQQQQQG
eukprot:TRINITY_DN1985_c0_g2_i6.p1 TRINITY_DN1985_c0_g2~~TRINITY_DN1985_c0_g2_i6.p1  ORF type:complete len:210 (+),score=51.79 TRINITY_DN1985_c0_g2_i6:228-857(+)